MKQSYKMRINRMTVDKLGVKLYDRAYAVIAELISNSYDADAEIVTVRAPMGQYLASKVGGKLQSKAVSIEVEDNGVGMCPEELQAFYLVVGSERRRDPRRGDLSKKHGRKVMGRKGVGKLAPFGVCRVVEIISAGGGKTSDNEQEGYRVAHVILNKEYILEDSEEDYEPEVGNLDGTLSEETYTKVILRDFDYRYVGTIDELGRQLSQRFGLSSENWRIVLEDTSKAVSHPEHRKDVGNFDVSIMPGTKIEFKGQHPTISQSSSSGYVVEKPDGTTNGLTSGFEVENKFYPVVGWIAYAKEAYKDELMAGVRIYCRGKFAAQTTVFNRASGFTGEFGIRSYIIGMLHADWLDEEEDLIQTDRRDILWSHELGAAFQKWGQKIVEHIGKLARNPMRQTTMDIFLKEGNVEERVKQEFPGKDQKDLRDGAIEVAKMLGKSMRGDEVYDQQMCEDMVQLSLMLAPLRTLDEKLREAGDENATPLSVVNDILRTAKLAETATFGRAVQKRIQIIRRLERLKDSKDTPESELQKLIEEAPW
ncbi:MAG: ATP-binding protein, partial [Methylococcaceae bacterium]